MNYNIYFVGIDVSDSLEILTIEKLDALAERYKWTINATVFYKREANDPVKGKICEIKLSESGPLLFATSNEKSFEMALSETIKDLTVQLKKRKDKMNSRTKSAYRSI